MKQMILTGLASEQNFSGSTKFYLVFNDGELRVPVTEESAQLVIEAMYKPNGKVLVETPAYDNSQYIVNDEILDEDGVPQA
jgi:hypothetical protein